MNVKKIVKQYRWKFYFTLFLILSQSALALFFPLFIGYAIDGALIEDYSGAMYLGLLGLGALIVGSTRRFYDSRFYAQVFKTYGLDAVSTVEEDKVSVRTARLNMMRETIEFMEHSLPELIENVIGLVGVIAIIATLNLKIFFGSVVVTFLVFSVYLITGKKTIRYNKEYNNELERQVDAVSIPDVNPLKNHVMKLMKWNIRLSDLETVNFSISWIFLMLFLVGSIILAISDGITQYGALFALVMYVFQYMGSIVNLPFFYQEWLRLTEIKKRLEAS